MTDPTADAAKLLARAIMDEWAIEIPRRPTMMLPPFFMAEIAARAALNTRPLPAPPTGEPDFHRWLDQKIAEWSAAGGFHDFAVAAKVIRDRLGLAARPKVEDHEVEAEVERNLYESMQEFNRRYGLESPTMSIREVDLDELSTADLIQRLIYERDRAEAAEFKLAQRDAELAAAHKELIEAAWIIEGAESSVMSSAWVQRMMKFIERHAARQQQKASAETTERKGE